MNILIPFWVVLVLAAVGVFLLERFLRTKR